MSNNSEKIYFVQLDFSDPVYILYSSGTAGLPKYIKLRDMNANKYIGLAGVIVGETAISTVGKKGFGLSYRGYSINDLVNYSSFEEVSYLLIYGHLPTLKELESYMLRLSFKRHLSEELKSVLKLLPSTAHPMDVLRSTISVLGCLEPEIDKHNQFLISKCLFSIAPISVLYWYLYHKW